MSKLCIKLEGSCNSFLLHLKYNPKNSLGLFAEERLKKIIVHQKRVRNICFIFPKVYIDCTLLTVLTKLMHVTDVFIIDDRTFSINRDVDIQFVSFLPRVPT